MSLPSWVRTQVQSRRADNLFFSAMMLLMATTVFIGFARSYFLAGMLRAKLPSPLVHVHGALFTLWIVVILAQVTLVATGHVRWHLQLGNFGMVIAASMVVIGLVTVLLAERRNFAPPAIFTFDVTTILGFGLLVGWGYRVRRDPTAHKRLMMLATLALMPQALGRWPYAFLNSDAVFYTVLNLPLALLIVYDIYSRRRLQRVTIAGAILLATLQLSYIPLSNSRPVRALIADLQKK